MSMVHSSIPAAGPGAQLSREGFFTHHGPWALGVRLFRALQFRTKALIISATFLLPVALLSASLWTSSQEIVDFAAKERAGVVVIKSLMPVFENVLETRIASRSMLGGFDAANDYRQAREKTDKAVAALKQGVAASGDPIGVAASVAKLESAWQVTAQAKNGADEKGNTVFAPLTTALVELLTKVGDDSNLVFESDVDAFYLVNAMVLAMPAAAEALGQMWGWGTYALAKGELDAKNTKRYYGWSINAATKLAEARTYFGRATSATPALKTKLDLAPLDAAEAFEKSAASAVEAGKGDAAKLYADGLAATTGIFKVYASGLSALDDLLAARLRAAQQARNIRFAVVLACLLLAGYLFYSFYLVTLGGLNEVKRHLVAMTGGDLTTSPNPWGKDEAAALMLSLHDMQASLRNIVSQVRGSSDSIVHASTEIAAASIDLSARTEQTAASLEQSASSMEEISSTVKHTAENVREAAQVASHNSQSAARGGEVIKDVVSTMQEINASSKKISDIIGTIDGIAFQTNILALNAAVEAARAGEQGRGFAVVASEVRSLAQRSTQAAREIKTLITTSVEKVESGTNIVKGAGETMQELVVNARRMNDLLAEISTAASEQSNGVAQVGAAVNELDRMTQQNAALVEQTAAAASALKDQAVGLAGEVAKFRMPVGRH